MICAKVEVNSEAKEICGEHHASGPLLWVLKNSSTSAEVITGPSMDLTLSATSLHNCETPSSSWPKMSGFAAYTLHIQNVLYVFPNLLLNMAVSRLQSSPITIMGLCMKTLCWSPFSQSLQLKDCYCIACPGMKAL